MILTLQEERSTVRKMVVHSPGWSGSRPLATLRTSLSAIHRGIR